MDSPEYKALARCYSRLLIYIRQAPNDIADHLRPSGILAPQDFSYLNNPGHDHDVKARRLLDAVLDRVKVDPQVYHTFVAALKAAGHWTEAAVSELEHSSDSVVQSPIDDVRFARAPGENYVSLFLVFVHIVVNRLQF